MTELEMSLTLGMITEPIRNKVDVDPMVQIEILFLKHIFNINRLQREEVGTPNPDLWADLLPWHSLN